MSKYVKYKTGKPRVIGVYACRVPVPGLHEAPEFQVTDVFLMWIDGRWGYLGSDQYYRGEVMGWIGPLSRQLPKKAEGDQKR